MSEIISFAALTRGIHSSVRVTADALIYAVDLAMVVTGLDRDAAGLALRRILNKKTVTFNVTERNTGGLGNYKTKLVNFKDALQLIMVLGGDIAKETRAQFAEILTDYFGGKESLVDKIRANAASDSPIAQMARACDPEDEQARSKRIKREDLEIKREEMDIKREEIELVKLEQEVQIMRMQGAQLFMDTMNRINPTWMKTDTRFRLSTEDMVKNIITTPSTQLCQLSLTNGDSKTLSIGQLAQELGYKRPSHSDSIRAGAIAAKRYRETHDNAEPAKHRQWVDGCERVVNSYTEADRDMLTEVLTGLGWAR